MHVYICIVVTFFSFVCPYLYPFGFCSVFLHSYLVFCCVVLLYLCNALLWIYFKLLGEIQAVETVKVGQVR